MAYAQPMEIKKKISAAESSILWKAYKVLGSHTGVVNFKKGWLIFDKNRLIGGEFEVDMTSIRSIDMKGRFKSKLESHLKSNDFFGIATNPTSKMVFKKIRVSGKNSYEIEGNLTIKGITKPISFDLSIYGNQATSMLKLDRADFNVGYGTGSFFENLGDKTMFDEFNVYIDLVF